MMISHQNAMYVFDMSKKKNNSALSVPDNEILTSAPSSISAKIERMEREGVRTALVRS